MTQKSLENEGAAFEPPFPGVKHADEGTFARLPGGLERAQPSPRMTAYIVALLRLPPSSRAYRKKRVPQSNRASE